MIEKRVGHILNLISDPFDLATWVDKKITRYFKFATFKRVINTKTSIIQIGSNKIY